MILKINNKKLKKGDFLNCRGSNHASFTALHN